MSRHRPHCDNLRLTKLEPNRYVSIFCTRNYGGLCTERSDLWEGGLYDTSGVDALEDSTTHSVAVYMWLGLLEAVLTPRVRTADTLASQL